MIYIGIDFSINYASFCICRDFKDFKLISCINTKMTKKNEKFSSVDQKMMKRCFQLAAKGSGFTAPNPMVGAVIVKNGEIISEITSF